MLDALLLLLIANGAPVLTRLLLGRRLTFPIDGGRIAADGRPWLGRSKTVAGLIASLVATTIAALLLGHDWQLGLVFGALAMTGDLASSYSKRRLGLPPGSQAPGLDQLPETLFPLAACAGVLGLHWGEVLLLALVFMALDIVVTRLLLQPLRR